MSGREKPTKGGCSSPENEEKKRVVRGKEWNWTHAQMILDQTRYNITRSMPPADVHRWEGWQSCHLPQLTISAGNSIFHLTFCKNFIFKVFFVCLIYHNYSNVNFYSSTLKKYNYPADSLDNVCNFWADIAIIDFHFFRRRFSAFCAFYLRWRAWKRGAKRPGGNLARHHCRSWGVVVINTFPICAGRV